MNRCDLLKHSGGVDPLPHAEPASRLILNSADALFPGECMYWVRAACIGRDDRSEFARLVVRQLRSRKVCLRQSVKSSASIFTVGKSSGGLREVWNGHDLSTLAAIPPKPPHSAGVTALVDLEASAEVPIVAFKRDARCFFDQLDLPEPLRGHFGRPWLRASDIIRYTDMGKCKLIKHLWPYAIFVPEPVVHPCCAT